MERSIVYYHFTGYNPKVKQTGFSGPSITLKEFKERIMQREKVPKFFDLTVVNKNTYKLIRGDDTEIPKNTLVEISRRSKPKLKPSTTEESAMETTLKPPTPEEAAMEAALKQLKNKVEEVKALAKQADDLLDEAYAEATAAKKKKLEPEPEPKFWRVLIKTVEKLGIFQLLSELERNLGHPFNPIYINIEDPDITLHVETKVVAEELKALDGIVLLDHKMAINIERGPSTTQ